MLGRLGFGTAALDAKLLAGFAFGLSSLDMAVREHEPVAPEQAERLAGLMQRRLSGEPIARIVGHQEFYGLSFELNPATLVPRPETELLVDLALAAIGNKPAAVLDLGTGTGCVIVALLANALASHGVGVDLSAQALQCAQANADRHNVQNRLELLNGSWFGALTGRKQAPSAAGEVAGRFDLIVSNPPYIESGVIPTLARDVRDYDPLLALDGGIDGLGPYRIIASQAGAWLKSGGQLIVEIGSGQGGSVRALFETSGFERVYITQDLAGHDRVVSGSYFG